MIKAVLDANVIISSIFWRGKPYQLMRRGIEGKCTFVISMPIIDEVASKLRSKFHLPEDKIGMLVDILLAFSTIVEPKPKLNAVKADASDNFSPCLYWQLKAQNLQRYPNASKSKKFSRNNVFYTNISKSKSLHFSEF